MKMVGRLDSNQRPSGPESHAHQIQITRSARRGAERSRPVRATPGGPGVVQAQHCREGDPGGGCKSISCRDSIKKSEEREPQQLAPQRFHHNLPLMAGETRRRDHLWALAVPILMGLAGWLVGLLLFDVFGAGYLRAFFGRLVHLGR